MADRHKGRSVVPPEEEVFNESPCQEPNVTHWLLTVRDSDFLGLSDSVKKI